MSNMSISGVIVPHDTPASTTIVGPQGEQPEKTEASYAPDSWIWQVEKQETHVIESPVAKSKASIVSTVPHHVLPFVRAVANIGGVRCVVVEDGENRSVHVTTFVEGLSREVREQIYRLEAETIRTNPDIVFDFHVRRAEEVTRSPSGIAGKHYYAVWGNLDAARS